MAKRLSQSKKADLVVLAGEVVRYHSPNSGATDLLRIIRENEITLHFDKYGDAFDGALEFADGDFHIHVNLERYGSRDSDRARFTIAHELGHFFIPEHRLALLSGQESHGSTCGLFDSAESPEELEADLFAANLLMLPERFLGALRATDSPLSAIKHLSSLFRSSMTATAIHYASVAANRCAIIRWNPNQEFAWCKIGIEYKVEGFNRPKYADCVNPETDSATGMVFAGQVAEGKTVSTMAMLFSNVAAGKSRDHLLIEEAVVLGAYGFMTIISDFKG